MGAQHTAGPVSADNAHSLAVAFPSNWSRDWDDVRYWIDLKTGGGLDCVQLDLLTDMVVARLTPWQGRDFHRHRVSLAKARGAA
jgi:hypothetical protein